MRAIIRVLGMVFVGTLCLNSDALACEREEPTPTPASTPTAMSSPTKTDERAPASFKNSSTDSRKKRDQRVNDHIIKTYKGMELKGQEVQMQNQRTKKVRDATSYKEPSPDYLQMDQEVIHVPDRDPFRFVEQNKKAPPDAEIHKEMSEEQNRPKGTYNKELFDEKALKEETFTIKNQRRKPSSVKPAVVKPSGANKKSR